MVKKITLRDIAGGSHIVNSKTVVNLFRNTSSSFDRQFLDCLYRGILLKGKKLNPEGYLIIMVFGILLLIGIFAVFAKPPVGTENPMPLRLAGAGLASVGAIALLVFYLKASACVYLDQTGVVFCNNRNSLFISYDNIASVSCFSGSNKYIEFKLKTDSDPLRYLINRGGAEGVGRNIPKDLDMVYRKDQLVPTLQFARKLDVSHDTFRNMLKMADVLTRGEGESKAV